MAVYEADMSQKCGTFHRGPKVDIVGVTGSIPVTPTIRIHKRVSEQSETLFSFLLQPSPFSSEAISVAAGFLLRMSFKSLRWRGMFAINFALKNKIQCR
ncbi:hypothetical protein EGT36_21295 [Agrobacterium sp. FDAARGOS_525]|nr:hypothetical protein EGT36_21295 [Agrobacterium sp. FDAARGOS_525]